MRRFKDIGHGKGYRNILQTDPTIHAQSAQGIKQPQILPYLYSGQLYNGTYGRKIINVEAIVDDLKMGKLSNVRFNGDRINFCWKGKWLGNWGHSLKDNRIFLDKDIPDRYKPQMAIHEAIEQYVSEKFGLKYREAHEVAEHWEKEYAKMQGINWKKSQDAIFNTKI
jgi:hypothetical protein